jgi:hypothetical protein
LWLFPVQLGVHLPCRKVQLSNLCLPGTLDSSANLISNWKSELESIKQKKKESSFTHFFCIYKFIVELLTTPAHSTSLALKAKSQKGSILTTPNSTTEKQKTLGQGSKPHVVCLELSPLIHGRQENFHKSSYFPEPTGYDLSPWEIEGLGWTSTHMGTSTFSSEAS